MIALAMLWRARTWARQTGWAGGVAVVAAISVVVVYVFLLRPLSHALVDARDEGLRAAAAAAATGAGSARIGPGTPTEELTAFYDFFPPRERLPDYLERIYRAADQQGVQLDRGDYQLEPENDLKLMRHGIALPVKGSYLQIRRFVAQVQNDVPALALDGIVFSRQRIDAAQIDAQIRFVLYLRPGS